jgi:hypothetical protein
MTKRGEPIELVCDLCGEEVPAQDAEILQTVEETVWGAPDETTFQEGDPAVADLRQGAICLCKVCLVFVIPQITVEDEEDEIA